MISNTLGAPLGGTTLGGQPGLESAALRLILPVKGGGGFGIYFPSMVVVAPGDPSAGVVTEVAFVVGAAFPFVDFCWATLRVRGAPASDMAISAATNEAPISGRE